MNKIKNIYFCLFLSFFVLIVFTLFKIKNHEDYKQKVILAHEIHKVLENLMFDLSQARESSILDVPADGEWHKRIAFDHARLGALEYMIKDGHLLRINRGKVLLIADHISDLRIRRQKETPDILEVQIEARKNVSLISYLKVRIRQ